MYAGARDIPYHKFLPCSLLMSARLSGPNRISLTPLGAQLSFGAVRVDVGKRHRFPLRERQDKGMAEVEEPEFRAAVMPGFVSGLTTRIEGYGAGLRTPAARLRTRVLERLKHLGLNLLGHATSQTPGDVILAREAFLERILVTRGEHGP
jgi:hypothetical protein